MWFQTHGIKQKGYIFQNKRTKKESLFSAIYLLGVD